MNPTTTGTKRRRYSAEEKNEILAAYQKRTTSQLEFCRTQGLCLATVRSWVAKHSEPSGGLVEIPPVRQHGDDYCVQMELRDGTVLRIAVGTDPRWLRQLVLSLRCGA